MLTLKIVLEQHKKKIMKFTIFCLLAVASAATSSGEDVLQVEPEGNTRGSAGRALTPLRRLSGRVTVKRKSEKALKGEGKTQAEIDDIRGRGMSAIAQEKVVFTDDGLDIQVVEVPGGVGNEEAFINQFTHGSRNDLYEYVEIDYLESPLETIPDDPLMGQSWQHDAMESRLAWDIHTGGPSVTVAICDTGLQVTHPDLAANKVEGYNAVTELTESQGGDISPVQSHGTRCAGCAAAIGNNGVGMAGVGWNFKHRPIQVSTEALGGSAYSSTLAACARWACDQGDIASVSYSGVEGQSRRDAATHCKSKNRLMFNAAGNDNRDITGYNADADDLIVVGATTSTDQRSGFSAYGSFVDIMAPGSSILATSYDGNGNSNYVYTSGTSFSCPFTAGLAALIWSAAPTLTADQVEQVLKESATDLGSPGYDNTFAHGRINSYQAMLHPLVQGGGGGGGGGGSGTNAPTKSPTTRPSDSPTSPPTTALPTTAGPTESPTPMPTNSPTGLVEKYICKKTDPGRDEICLNGAVSENNACSTVLGGVNGDTGCGNGGKVCWIIPDCPDTSGGGGGGGGGVGDGCSAASCAGCAGGGECKAVGCTWSQGTCA